MESFDPNRYTWGKDNIPHRLTNDELQCDGCAFCMEVVSECEKYLEKPGYVLNSTAPCKYYKQKETSHE